MKPNPLHRLPAPLELAVQRLKLAAREAAERTVESLGLAALAAHTAFERDALLAAQFELNRKSAVFALTFADAFDERVLRELGPRAMAAASTGHTVSGASTRAAGPAVTNWDALSLVEDREVEAQISAERFGMEIAHACEWELRELEAYVATVLAEAGGERERNPLRPELVGHAMLKAVEAVSDRSDVRKLLSSEIARSLGGLLRGTYTGVVADFRKAGVQPLGLAVRHRPGASGAAPGEITQPGTLQAQEPRSRYAEVPRSGYGHPGGYSAVPRSGFGGSGTSGGYSTRGGTPLGQVDAGMMNLIRRLAHHDAMPTGGYAGGGYAEGGGGVVDASAGGLPPLANLIHAHRDELRQASRGSLDHMVIDVIGFLFDQILADPKVPPQMARQIARLQLPVLRAALGDGSFFSSRRHPVRRFINRIASLGAAFEDFDEEAAKNVLAKVRTLVAEVVDGDFDQIEVYEQKLYALEQFVAEQASRDVAQQGNAAELLQAKEDELRLKQLYAERLTSELKGVSAPAFVLDFVSRIWSQVLITAATKNADAGGADSEQAARLRKAGRELLLSVQPKPTAAHRKQFLADLPKLMLELTEGMNLIRWPEEQRRAFFGQLMPAHAEALKSSATVRQLDLNLMAKHVEGALQRSTPTREEARASSYLPVLDEAIDDPALLTREEVQQVGLVQAASIDWDGTVDIDITAADAAEASEVARRGHEPAAPGLPALADAPDATQGAALADQVQIGFAYQMHVNDKWQKVRLSHVSPGRTFFIFTQGSRHKKTVSLTQRMLRRLCETGRFRAYEQATLLERATERARRQLSALGPRAVH
jgi:Protein of unknown function (DUF1631)